METLIAGLSGVAIPLLIVVIAYLRNIKKELKEHVDKICMTNERDHQEIWERVNHHLHNGNGRVVGMVTAYWRQVNCRRQPLDVAVNVRRGISWREFVFLEP